jgi:hypothetical protein
MDFFTQRYYSQEVLQQRAESVHVSFAAYLDRANFEVKYLSEQISDGETIDRLFQLHDVLFFGGLDFFYVALEDGTSMEDPRVRDSNIATAGSTFPSTNSRKAPPPVEM